MDAEPPPLPAFAERYRRRWEDAQFAQLRADAHCVSQFDRRCGSDPLFTPRGPPPIPLRIPESDRRFRRCPEATPDPLVPEGALHQHREWGHSVVYPGTLRDFDVYLPPPSAPALELAIIVIPDGMAAWQSTRITTVLENLMHAGRVPPTAVVFLGIGWEPSTGARAMRPRQLFPTSLPGMLQRFTELDTVGPGFVRHVDDELLPWVEQAHGVRFSSDPRRRIMMGQSSGATAAVMAAWARPQSFGSVLGVSTSFPHTVPGYLWPRTVRSSEKKPLRVALVVGEFDVVDAGGDWLQHTLLAGNALEYKGYVHRVDVAEGGGHTLRYVSSKLAELLLWLFDDIRDGGGGPAVPSSNRSRL